MLPREMERTGARQSLLRSSCDRCGARNTTQRPFAIRFADGSSGKQWSRMSRHRRDELLELGYEILCHSCSSPRKMLSDQECEDLANDVLRRHGVLRG